MAGLAAPATASDAELRGLLEQSGRSPAVLILLVHRSLCPAQVLEAARAVSPELAAMSAAITTRALAALPATIDAALTRGELGGAAATAVRTARWLDAVETKSPADRPMVQARRAELARACTERFDRAIDQDLLSPLALPGAGLGNAEIAAAELAARELRRLETAGRRLGHGESYTRTLQLAARQLEDPGFAGLRKADRIRLAEILLGPEHAATLM